MTQMFVCECENPNPHVNGEGARVCANKGCGGAIEKDSNAESKSDILTREDLSVALLEIDRVERELKTMAGRVGAVKAILKSKLTSQVG